MKTLVAGPWVGEFGWELCRWIPHVRYRARGYERVVVICQPGHDYLYSDFCDEFIHFKGSGSPNCWRAGKISRQDMDGIYQQVGDCDKIEPGPYLRDTTDLFYWMYGNFGSEEPGYDVLIHARATENLHTGYRNWSIERWEIFVSALSRRVACIGSVSGAHHINGAIDLRGIPLNRLAGYMSTAKVVVGPSSGPMHFASLCGAPHVVWTDSKRQGPISTTNKHRYQVAWNPFSTGCSVIEHKEWRPSVESVIKTTTAILSDDYKGALKLAKKAMSKKPKKSEPAIAMITYERQKYFDRTMAGLIGRVKPSKVVIFDDNSQDVAKKNSLKRCRGYGFRVFQNSRRLNIMKNTCLAIDTAWNLFGDKVIFYLQDDVEFDPDWHKKAVDTIQQMTDSGLDWGILALWNQKWPTNEPYQVLTEGHPGGVAWAVNREMWTQYRTEHDIYGKPAKERLADYQICHWCHHNERREWAVCYVGKTLIRHRGTDSIATPGRDMSQYVGI